MNKSRIVLLGALVSLLSLTGCGAVSGLVDVTKNLTAKLTGADDPKNNSLMARAGRLHNEGADVVAGAVGIKTAESESPVLVATPSETVVAVSPAPIPTAPVAASAPTTAKKVATKKPPSKDGTLKTVAATTGGKSELPKVAKTDKSQ